MNFKMFVSSGDSVPCFTGFTLIMPAVSVGNVGQLAVDLLVSTLNMPRVGYFHTDCLLPVAGSNPYATSPDDDAQLCTSADVYSHTDLKLAVLQIRSPIIQNKVKLFRKQVVSWMKSCGFLRSVLLSSSHAYQRDDQQLHGTPLRYLLSPCLEKKEGQVLEDLDWREMERVSAFPGISDSEHCTEDLPLAVVLIFCSEGDNIPDAFALISHLNNWLHLLDKPAQGSVQWRVPPSWRLLFGSGIPPLLF
ncbi:hypothetical protein DNTS_017299 [Danionella cerebrum]|uniref:Proteasome assembly chaperone 2 n=1 Tax=Danionella cerebrum TaxID=2873325 RepID=A0A553MYG1_9TELE|nr:hypothetical protein DNTS_017299 [Danionella translucida]